MSQKAEVSWFYHLRKLLIEIRYESELVRVIPRTLKYRFNRLIYIGGVCCSGGLVGDEILQW